MNTELLTVVTDSTVKIICALVTLAVTYYVVPAIKNQLIPYLKDKNLYETVVKFVKAAEKLGESGAIAKADKNQFVINLLESKGIEVTDEVKALIESAVQELDTTAVEVIKEVTDTITDSTDATETEESTETKEVITEDTNVAKNGTDEVAEVSEETATEEKQTIEVTAQQLEALKTLNIVAEQ